MSKKSVKKYKNCKKCKTRKRLQNKKPKEYHLAKKYFNFLGTRTKKDDKDRYKATFKV